MKKINLIITLLLLTAILFGSFGCSKNGKITYTPSGDEKNEAGYAEGTLVYKPKSIKDGTVYELYWGNDDNILTNYYPISSVTVSEETKNIEFNIGENVAIPSAASKFFVTMKESEDSPCEIVSKLSIPKNKRIIETPEMVFASVSDVHVNYVEGAKYWTHALDYYEDALAKYVIISGDLTSDGSQFAKYKSATEKSKYTGLIFTCIGNHEQQKAGRAAVFEGAIYDGSCKKWISLSEAENYFKNVYSGGLDVSVEWSDIEGNDNTYYYAAKINGMKYIFMDQMLSATGNSSLEDNFSDAQLDWVEKMLSEKGYEMNIVEHGLIKNFSSGDKFNGSYTQPILLSSKFTRNNRFADILLNNPEAIWMSGHTHLGFGTSVDYIDKEYDENGNPTGRPMARSIHNSSVAQARWYAGDSIVYKETFESGSEGYICYKYKDSIVYSGIAFKEYTPGVKMITDASYVNKVFPASTFRMKRFVK